MSEKHHKAIVINWWWASIFGTLLAALIIGTAGSVWSAARAQAVLQEKVEKMEEARLPERMARIEETVKSTDKTVDDIKSMQRDMNGKIDRLLMAGSSPSR